MIKIAAENIMITKLKPCRFCQKQFRVYGNTQICDNIHCKKLQLEYKKLRHQTNNRKYRKNLSDLKQSQSRQTQRIWDKKLKLIMPKKKRITSVLGQMRIRTIKNKWHFDKEEMRKYLIELCERTTCMCCFRELDYTYHLDKRHYDNYPSFDRFDNSKGYFPKNVKLICYKCNTIKNNATQEDIIAVHNYMLGGEQKRLK